MTDRHRGGGPRGFDRDRRPNYEGGRSEGGDRGGYRGGGGGFDRPRPGYGGDRPSFGGGRPGGFGGDRPPFGDRPQFGGGGRGDDRPGGGDRRPPFRDQRPPAPPAEAEDEFEEVDTTLAVAILDTATRLTALIVDKGLPADIEGRRAAVLEEFGVVYATILETVTSLDEEEEDEDEDGEE